MAIHHHPLTSLSFLPLHPSNPNILLYTPPPPSPIPTPSHPPNSPKLVILTTWLGGSTSSRIAVYCRGYQALYPYTPILLLRTVLADITTASFASVQRQLEPAREYLLSLFPPSPESPAPTTNTAAPATHTERIDPQHGALLHIFSHGGCNTALQLSRLLRSSSPVVPLPLLGLILDSCPGSPSPTKSYTAATYSLPRSPSLNLAGRALLLPLIGALTSLQAVGLVSSISDLRRELNDPLTFGVVPRLYLHSLADEVVGAEDVVEHAREAEGRGMSVRREVWEEAGHCALVVEDGERYWRFVGEFVEAEGRKREVKL